MVRTEIKKDLLKPLLTCPLCDGILEEATGNSKCSHTFCRKCIYSMIVEKEIKSCPVCKTYWGTNPVAKMRPDLIYQSLRKTIFPLDKGKEKEKAPSPLGASSLIVSVENVEELLEFDSDIILSSLSSSDMTLSPFEDDQSTDEGAKNGDDAESQEARLDTQKRMKAKSKEKKGKRKLNDKKISTGRKKKHACGRSIKSPQEVLDDMLLRNDSFCFNLVASRNQEGTLPLPQIRSQYIRVKDGSTTVSFIQKYLKQKLGLESESEIEIKCNRISVHPMMQIRELLQSWLDTVSTEERITTTNGSATREFVAVLTYGRRKVPNHGSEL